MTTINHPIQDAETKREPSPVDEKARGELLKSIFEQHWLHARHVENERLWFTNIFGVIVAGLLAFLGTVEATNLALFATFTGSFIFVLSILGYFLCLSWRAPLVEHTTLAHKMLEADSILRRYIPYAKGYETIKFWGCSAHELFLYFYALMAGGAWFLILYFGLGKGEGKSPYLWISIVVGVIVFSSLCSLWRGYLVKKEKKYVEKAGTGYGRYAKKSNS